MLGKEIKNQNIITLVIISFILLVSSCTTDKVKQENNIVNDITQLNPIVVKDIITPKTISEIVDVVKRTNSPISIGGGRFSMGGQTATEKAIQIDMRKFNRIVKFSKAQKQITVQAGITWREVIQFIDKHNLSVRIMQTYANFTVGGSLSVNVHGRYVGEGPIILSVKSIKVILGNGDIVLGSPTINQNIFYAVIGGYGGIGIIAEATLLLTDNCKIERKDEVMDIKDYEQYFISKIKNNKSVIFHNADIYPNSFNEIRAVSYYKTTKLLTTQNRLKPNDGSYGFNRFAIKTVSGSSIGKWLRKDIANPIYYQSNPVEWRNYEATFDVKELEPSSRKKSTYVLQEYFVPAESFKSFYPMLVKILKDNEVNVLNISIRHAKQDPGSILAWAKTEVFAFVIYYEQGITQGDKQKVKLWTQQLIDASISLKGSYYLPYQIHATKKQFLNAYPKAEEFFRLKKKYDPNYKFRNKLFDAYYLNQ